MTRNNTILYNLALRFVKLLNVILITIPFALCWYMYYKEKLYAPFFRRGNWLIVLLFLVCYLYFGRVYDAFHISFYRISEMIYSQVLAAIIADVILYVLTTILVKYPTNPLPLMAAFGGQLVLSIIWCLLAHRWYFRVYPPRRAVVIYDMREGMENLIREYGMDKKYTVLSIIPVKECLENLDDLLEKEIHTVFLSGIHSHDRNIILKYCVLHRIHIFVIPRVGDVLMSAAKQVHMLHLPMLGVERYNPPPEYLIAKRLFDLLISGTMLVLLSPLMLITGLIIKTDGGPAFYRQRRMTRDGRIFEIMKFRSMRTDAEKDGVARLSTGENDMRVTPVGRVIRKFRIDELPQLFNVLKGEMSIVGPRPERPQIAEIYEKEMPEFRLRLQAKAGLTGYAQVYGKYNTTPYDKLQMDLMYIAHPSLLEDLRILIATVKVLFVPESTEGIKEGNSTALDKRSKRS